MLKDIGDNKMNIESAMHIVDTMCRDYIEKNNLNKESTEQKALNIIWGEVDALIDMEQGGWNK